MTILLEDVVMDGRSSEGRTAVRPYMGAGPRFEVALARARLQIDAEGVLEPSQGREVIGG